MKYLNIFICLLLILSIRAWSSVPIQKGAAFWNGQSLNLLPHHPRRHLIKQAGRIVSGTTIFFKPIHPYCYGHHLLDGCFTLYTLLREHNLLEDPSITLLFVFDKKWQSNKTLLNCIQLIKDIFCFKEIIFSDDSTLLEKPIFFETLIENNWQANGFFASYPESYNFMYKLQEFGFSENLIFQDKQNKTNVVHDFVNFILNGYKIDPNELHLIKNRLILSIRKNNRMILNLMDLDMSLRKNGYDVVQIDFESLPIREQIIEVVQSEYFLGTYGSNLTNAIFLQPSAKVVVLWPKHGKYFISRTWDIIYSAFLSVGVTLIEYDKPEYDQRDQYTDPSPYPTDWFYREENVLKLDPSITLDEIVQRPHPLLFHLFLVDIFIDPDDLISCLKSTTNQ
jgi:hypothetical protein